MDNEALAGDLRSRTINARVYILSMTNICRYHTHTYKQVAILINN